MKKRNSQTVLSYGMAPEMLYDTNRCDNKVDIWSLGIVLVELTKMVATNSEMQAMVKLDNPSEWTNEFNELLDKIFVMVRTRRC